MLHFYLCNVSDLHSSSVALFGCCNLFLLHFVHVALLSEVLPRPPQTSKMENFTKIINKAVKYCCKALRLRYLLGPGYASTISTLHFFHGYILFMLHFFHAALFSCCTFSTLHFFHVALFPSCTFSCCTLFILHFFHVALF